jgi:hypothetical protein
MRSQSQLMTTLRAMPSHSAPGLQLPLPVVAAHCSVLSRGLAGHQVAGCQFESQWHDKWDCSLSRRDEDPSVFSHMRIEGAMMQISSLQNTARFARLSNACLITNEHRCTAASAKLLLARPQPDVMNLPDQLIGSPLVRARRLENCPKKTRSRDRRSGSMRVRPTLILDYVSLHADGRSPSEEGHRTDAQYADDLLQSTY